MRFAVQNQATITQYPHVGNASTTNLPDPPPRKKFFLASGELLLAQMAPWVVDECIRKVDYTHLTWSVVPAGNSASHVVTIYFAGRNLLQSCNKFFVTNGIVTFFLLQTGGGLIIP